MPQIVLPSGLSGEVRNLKVREQNILSDIRKSKNSTALNEVLSKVWLRTDSLGPYSFSSGDIDWNKVLVGDHFAALLNVIAASYSGKYEFNIQCENEMCRGTIPWEVDPLELEVKSLSDESAKTFTNGNKFQGAVESTGQAFIFRLLQQRDMVRFGKSRKASPDKLVTAMLRLQIVSVDGVEKRDIPEWLEDLDASDSSDMQDQFDAAGCGIETTIEVQCMDCFREQECEIPFGRDWYSGKRKKEEKKKEKKKATQPATTEISSASPAS